MGAAARAVTRSERHREVMNDSTKNLTKAAWSVVSHNESRAEPSRAEPSREPSRAEPSVGYCLSSTSPPEFSAAPSPSAWSRHTLAAWRPARPGRPAATVLVLGLLLLGASAAEAQTVRDLVSNTAQTGDDSANTSGNDHAQLFHTGAHTAGYTLTAVIVNSDDAQDDDFDVEVCEEDGTSDEFPSTTASDCTALTAPGSFVGVGNVVFTHTGLALSANTNYVVVIKQRGTGSVELDSTTSSGEDSTGLSDWSIKNKFYWKSGSTWMIKSGSDEALAIIVKGVLGDTSDATLSALSVSGAPLTPAFAAATTNYHAVVANSVNQVTITETTSETAATVEYLDGSDATLTDADTTTAGLQVNLSVGANIVKVKVTAPNGTTTKTYTVNVVRGAVPVMCSPASMVNRIWTGNLTVGVQTTGFGTQSGYRPGVIGALDDTMFDFGGTTYTIDTLYTLVQGASRILAFSVDTDLTNDDDDLVLHIGANTYRLEDATYVALGHGYNFSTNVPTWADGNAVCLALTVVPPAVSSVAPTSDPGSDSTYAIGDTVTATVTFSAAVDITGSPQLELDFAGTAKAAACTAATNTTTMACAYEVVAGDSAPNGVAIAANTLTGGTITATGSTTNTANLDHVAVAIDAGHKVDGIRPTLVTTGPDAPTTSTDGTKIILTFSEDIAVDESKITVEAEATDGTTTTVNITSARLLGDKVELTLGSALTSTATITVAMMADAVEDSVGNINDALAATPVTNAITDDPDVSSVALTSSPGVDNTYGIGDAVEATVTFSAAVDITGTPQLELDFAGTAKAAACTAATNTTTMVCSYTVAVGDVAAGGIAIGANKLTGGTITATGSTTITADLTHAAVAASTSHKVDGIRPTLVTTGSDAPTTSTDGTKIILFFNEVIGGVDRTKITVKSDTTTQATVGSLSSGPRLELTLTTALTATATNLTVELAADAVEDTASNGNLAVPATAVTNALGAPDVPHSLDATPGNRQVMLSWVQPSGGAEVTHYEYEQDGSGTWISTGGTATSTTVTGLNNGQAYIFRVRAVNAQGNGDPATLEATPSRSTGGGGGDGGPSEPRPQAPRNLLAAGGDGQVTLTWDAPGDDGGAAITDYEVRIDGKGEWISTGSTDTTHTVTGLDNGTEYTFEVRAVNRNRKGRASDRVEATPRMTLALDFAYFANGDGIVSEVVLVNGDLHPIQPVLYFYDQEGEPIVAESVVDMTGDLGVQEDGGLTVSSSMEPLGELTISTHGQGNLVRGSVKVLSDGAIGGVLRFDLPGVGVAGVQASQPQRDAIFPVRSREGGIGTGMAIHNREEEAMEVSCRLMKGGVALEEVEIPLMANGQVSRFIGEVFTATDTSDLVGSVRCTAPGVGQFTGMALELDADNGIFTTLPVLPVSRGGRGREAVLDFAHFANGDGTISDLVFINLETEPSGPAPTPYHVAVPPTRPVIYFYDQEGSLMAPESLVDVTGDLGVTGEGALTIQTEMEPLGELTISTHGRGDLVAGSVKVLSEGAIGGVLRFDLPGIGVAGVGASQPMKDAIFPVRRQERGIDTGIALRNLDESELALICRLMKEGTVLEEKEISLVAYGQQARFIGEVFTGADTSDFVGSVRCSAPGEGMFTGVALELDAANRIFTTLPVVPVEERMSQE